MAYRCSYYQGKEEEARASRAKAEKQRQFGWLLVAVLLLMGAAHAVFARLREREGVRDGGRAGFAFNWTGAGGGSDGRGGRGRGLHSLWEDINDVSVFWEQDFILPSFFSPSPITCRTT
jgi:hypothetical protein